MHSPDWQCVNWQAGSAWCVTVLQNLWMALQYPGLCSIRSPGSRRADLSSEGALLLIPLFIHGGRGASVAQFALHMSQLQGRMSAFQCNYDGRKNLLHNPVCTQVILRLSKKLQGFK